MSRTTEKPTVPGAYWLRLGASVSLVKVEPWKDDSVAVYFDGDLVIMQPGDWVVKYMGKEAAEPLHEVFDSDTHLLHPEHVSD